MILSSVQRYASLVGILLSPVPGAKLMFGLIFLGVILSGLIYWQGFHAGAIGMIGALLLALGFFVLIWLPMWIGYLVSLSSARPIRLLANIKLISAALFLVFLVVAALLSALGMAIIRHHFNGYWEGVSFVLALYSICAVVAVLCLLRWPGVASFISAPAVIVFGNYLDGDFYYLSASCWPIFVGVIAVTWVFLFGFILRFSPRQQIKLPCLQSVKWLNVPGPRGLAAEFSSGLRPSITSFLLNGSDRIGMQILVLANWLAGLLGLTWLNINQAAGIDASTVGLLVMTSGSAFLICVYTVRFARILFNTRCVWLLVSTGRDGLFIAIEKAALRDSLTALIAIPLYWGALHLMGISAPLPEEVVRLVVFCCVMLTIAFYWEILLYSYQLTDWGQNLVRLVFYLLVIIGAIIFYNTMARQIAQWMALLAGAALASALRVQGVRCWQKVSFGRIRV